MPSTSHYFPNTALVLLIKQTYLSDFLNAIAPKKNERAAWKRCYRIHEIRSLTDGAFGVKWRLTIQPYVNRYQNAGPQHDRPTVDRVTSNIRSILRALHEEADEFECEELERDSIQRLPDRRNYPESQTFKENNPSIFEEYY